VIGPHRRELGVLAHLAELERLLGAPLTLRGRSTFARVARLLDGAAG
jgi:hypothetical protein